MKFDMVRKKFAININIKRRYYKKTITLEYEQATMYEVLEFLQESEKKGFSISWWVVDFVENFWDKKLNIIDKRVISVIYEKIYDSIRETYFEGAFWLLETVWEWNQEVSEDTSLSSYVVFLSKELKVDPIYILKNYTLSQLKFFTNGIVWNMNEATPEGKKKNRTAFLKEKCKNMDTNFVRNLLSTIENV